MGKPGARLQAIKAFRCALTGQKFAIALVDVGSHEPGALCVGARDDQCRDTADVRRETRRIQIALMRGARNEHFAAEMAALLLRRQLILEMHSGSARLDVRLLDLMRIERPAEARLHICNYWDEPLM